MKFAVITFPYSVDSDYGTAEGPDALLQAGLADWLCEQRNEVVGPFHVKLSPYGAWNKIGFANAHLAKHVFEATQAQAFPLLFEILKLRLSTSELLDEWTSLYGRLKKRTKARNNIVHWFHATKPWRLEVG